jgi:predicted metal-binding protein
MDGSTAPTPQATLTVCTTCRREGVEDEVRPGARMLAALAAAPSGVIVRAVECLSACQNGCAVALSAPGKWSYVYGRLDPATDAAEVLRGAALYAASTTGLVPWRERPEVFRKQSLARIPPQE